MATQNGEDGVDICEDNKSGAILIDSICQEPPILKSKENMVDGAEGKNTGSFPQENSCAKENQSYANQLSNLNDVFEENKKKMQRI